MNKEPTFNYILNDLAFLNLQIKVLYGKPTEQDLFDFEYQLKLKEKEKYKEVIDKATEYVKEHKYYAHTIDIDYLLDILKEVE